MKPAIERIADALEAISEKMGVVYCEDCRHYISPWATGEGRVCIRPHHTSTWTKPDDYCSYGEKVDVDDDQID